MVAKTVKKMKARRSKTAQNVIGYELLPIAATKIFHVSLNDPVDPYISSKICSQELSDFSPTVWSET